MSAPIVTAIALPDYPLWKNIEGKRTLLALELEITARCNNNCRHCYINLPANDPRARNKELTFDQLKDVIDEAVSLGTLWCLITGGEPLLREDFIDIYLYLKKRGLLVSVFTNAALLTPAHINLFKQYSPRELEVSVYGITQNTYERVTRTPGSFDAFRRGLDLLFANRIKTRLKAMALRSNLREMADIARFCRKHTRDYYRFDPFLHMRIDQNQKRNREIKSERLSPLDIVNLEKSDPKRFQALKKACQESPLSKPSELTGNRLFRCGIGNGSLTVGYNGLLRMCSSLCKPDCVYDLKNGTLTEAWQNFVPQVQQFSGQTKEVLNKCRSCLLINLCQWCPAHAHLETGMMDQPIDYFCQMAHARAVAVLE
ncbi:MAG: radical SAM protein [Desulfobacterales bacterium]|nr:radical SAM protein [Desulfobacterales bacterium]